MKPNHNRAITQGDRARTSGNLGGKLNKAQIYERLKDKPHSTLLYIASNGSTQDWRDAATDLLSKDNFKKPKNQRK